MQAHAFERQECSLGYGYQTFSNCRGQFPPFHDLQYRIFCKSNLHCFYTHRTRLTCQNKVDSFCEKSISTFFGQRGLHSPDTSRQKRFRINAELEVASAIDVINDLGFDTLTFLCVTVGIIPIFKRLKVSPVRFCY